MAVIWNEASEQSSEGSCNQFTSLAHFDVWYKRLKHMSIKKTKFVFEHADFCNKNNTIMCDICP